MQLFCTFVYGFINIHEEFSGELAKAQTPNFCFIHRSGICMNFNVSDVINARRARSVLLILLIVTNAICARSPYPTSTRTLIRTYM